MKSLLTLMKSLSMTFQYKLYIAWCVFQELARILLQVKTGAVLTSCVRCLKEIYLPVETEFEELYQFMTRHREEEDLILPNDGYLDLGPCFENT